MKPSRHTAVRLALSILLSAVFAAVTHFNLILVEPIGILSAMLTVLDWPHIVVGFWASDWLRGLYESTGPLASDLAVVGTTLPVPCLYVWIVAGVVDRMGSTAHRPRSAGD